MGTTPNYNIQYPDSGDQWDLINDLQALADTTDTAIDGVDSKFPVALGSNVSGFLPIANGGTGATSLAAAKVALGITTAFNFASPGYMVMQNGLIMQWGVTPDGASNTNIGFTFPIAFPNAILGAVGITRAGASFGKGANLDGFTNTYVSMSHNAGASTNIRVIVIGY